MKTKNKEKFDLFSVSYIALSHFSNDIFSHFISPLLPILINNLGMTYAMGGALSIFHRFPAFFNPTIGKIVAKNDNRIIISITIFITAVCICCVTLAPNYFILCLLILIMGISTCFYHIPAMVMTREYSGNRSGAGMSLFMTGGELARGFGPIIVLAAISAWGERRIFYLLPISIFTSTLIFFKFRKREQILNMSSRKTEAPFLQILRENKAFFSFCFFFSISRAFSASVLNSFLPTYLTKQGFSLWFSGISLSVLQFSAVAGTLISGTVSDKFGKLNTLMVISVLTPILLCLFVFFSLVPGKTAIMEIFIGLCGFFSFSSAPVLMALIQDRGIANPTTFSSAYNMIDFLTISIALTTTGFLSDIFTMANAFKICSVISCISFPMILAVKIKKRREN